MKERDTFPNTSSVIPMSVALFTTGMKLGTAISAWRNHNKGKESDTSTGKDFYHYNLQKFRYIQSIKPRGFQDI
jgi:hypothetical protein